MDIPQISCSRRATFENDNTWVPGRTWRATFVSRPTVTCCHLVQRSLVGQRTWKTYSLWVLMYFDAVCRKLLVNSHCLHKGTFEHGHYVCMLAMLPQSEYCESNPHLVRGNFVVPLRVICISLFQSIKNNHDNFPVLLYIQIQWCVSAVRLYLIIS